MPETTLPTGIALPGIQAAAPTAAAAPVPKKGAKDYLAFMDETEEIFYAYLYHRTGSVAEADAVFGDVHLQILSRALSLWWFGTLSLKLLLDASEKILQGKEAAAADIDTVYLRSLAWFSDDEKRTVATLHDSLWSLPASAQQLLILSYLVGLSDERIAELLRQPIAAVHEQLGIAKDVLLTRWQPSDQLAGKMASLVFVPSPDPRIEAKVRFEIIEKSNALRLRRYQWVVMGGLFAVLSNVIVAGVLAFVVVTAPPTSLRGVQTQVASLDAVLLERRAALSRAQQSVATQISEARRLSAYDTAQNIATLGLMKAVDVIDAQQKSASEAGHVIELLKRAATAFIPVFKIAMAVLRIL